MISFAEKVYRLTRKIPKGRVAAYAEIARLIGSPRAVRAVGNALHKNPYSRVPCHRVIRSDGSLGGFASGAGRKARMLKNEGVKIVRNKIDLKKFGWNIK